MEEEGGDRSEEELIDMMDDMQYNKGCLRKMAQTLMDLQDQELANKAHAIMLKAMEIAEKITSKLWKIQVGKQ
jgi:hypothetical protein